MADPLLKKKQQFAPTPKSFAEVVLHYELGKETG